MKNELMKLDARLNEVHSVLTKLLFMQSDNKRHISDGLFEEIDNAEDKLESVRSALVQLAARSK